MISLDSAVDLVLHAFKDMAGGEIYVKKIPSMKVVDIAKAICPNCKIKIIGIRPGEKIHEKMISSSDSVNTFEFKDHYKILPSMYNWSVPQKVRVGKKVKKNFEYASNTNTQWMEVSELRNWIKKINRFLNLFTIEKKILIIGGASILSNYLISDLKENFEVYLLFNKRKRIISKTKRIDLDFNKKKDLNKQSYLKFFLIINCAAITDVDYCEKNYLKCLNSNFFLVKKIVDEIKNTKTKFVQISTDQLFISKNKFIKEIEPPKPLNNYAKSKFLAEKYITNNLKKFFIIRTNFFGWGLNYKNI